MYSRVEETDVLNALAMRLDLRQGSSSEERKLSQGSRLFFFFFSLGRGLQLESRPMFFSGTHISPGLGPRLPRPGLNSRSGTVLCQYKLVIYKQHQLALFSLNKIQHQWCPCRSIELQSGRTKMDKSNTVYIGS